MYRRKKYWPRCTDGDHDEEETIHGMYMNKHSMFHSATINLYIYIDEHMQCLRTDRRLVDMASWKENAGDIR
jgi:hypothetical protein